MLQTTIKYYKCLGIKPVPLLLLLITVFLVFPMKFVEAHVAKKDSTHIIALIDSAKANEFKMSLALADLDTARQIAKLVHSEQLLANVLMEKGNVYLKNSLLAQADSNFRQARSLMDKYPKKENYLELIRRQAVCAYSGGDYQKVLHLATGGLKEARAQKNQSFTATFFNISGVAYSGMEDQTAALKYYLKAFDIFNQMNNLEKIASVEVNIGTIYQTQGNDELAENYYLKALQIGKKINDKLIISTALNNLGDISAGRNEFKKSLNYFLQALEMNRKMKDDFGMAMSLSNVGDAYKGLNDASDEYLYYDSARILAKQIGDNVTYALSLTNLAEFYSNERNDLPKAITYGEHALSVARRGNNTNNMLEAFKLLNSLYAKGGKYKMAYSFLKKYNKLYDSLYSKEKSLQLVKLQKQYEFREKDREMALAVQKKKVFQAYLIASILALLVVTGFFLFISRIRFVKSRALKKQKRFVDNLLEESETHVLVLDRFAHNIYLSPSYEKHFGYKVEDRLGKNAMEFVHPKDQPALKGLLKNLQQGKITRSELSFRLRNQKGEYREVKGIVKNMLNNPEIEGFILNFWDVTDAKKAEMALEESERKYRQIFNAISDIYFRLDNHGVITEISPSVKQVAGYKPTEIIGKPVDDFMILDVGWDKAGRMFSRWGRIDDFDIMIKAHDGHKIHCSLNAHVLLNAEKKHEGFEGTLRDISTRVKAEQELKKANESKDKILSIIGHDLMGPIGTQKSILDMISDDIDDFSKEEMIQLIKTMRPAMDATFTMIENLLSWARIMRKSITPNLTENDIYPIVAKSFDLLKQQAQKKNIQLVYEGNDDFRAVFDKNLMEIVVRNLLSNAIKFSKPGDKVVVKAEKTKDFYEVSVSDQGVGMTDEDIRKIFSETEKMESKIGTNREKGTGLGLIIVKEFIQKNNGQLYIKSEEGKGTTFTFKLPKAGL